MKITKIVYAMRNGRVNEVHVFARDARGAKRIFVRDVNEGDDPVVVGRDLLRQVEADEVVA